MAMEEGGEMGDFCSGYLVVNPEEATILDLLRLLCSGADGEGRGFIDCSPEKKKLVLEDFWGRWLIFVSILAQKVLQLCKKPMAQIGSLLELWLNLLSSNGGTLPKLLLNILRGKVVIPDRGSATFSSVIGNLDERVELDRRIRWYDHGDRMRYEASLAVMAAKLSYENEAFIRTVVTDHWEMTFLGSYNFWNDYQEKLSTQAFMFKDTKADPELIVVAFRGTSPFDADDWQVDADVSWLELEGVGKMHAGFMKALGMQKGRGWPKEIAQEGERAYAYYAIRQKLRETMEKEERARFVVTGHSLGGALALLFAGILVLHEEREMLERLEGVYTFGQPRAGDEQFGLFMEEKFRGHNVRYFRYVYCNDMVPRLPYDGKALFYKHFGECLYYNSCYQGKIVGEEPDKNYFSMWWAIPKSLNALWELSRSFIIPYMEGPDYKEGWFLRLFRVIGLFIPGLSAHSPQDYVNSTRLGYLPSTL
ncbi:triacylglycerol lipase OBL1-like [Malania oleifera]|uniref:triacylglycerol lipase OBL1-like n=1 Tax=Malania oleifera TaxID=397392 RepID=UPI0025ADCB5C|nr:triacylglycerol lipase OBL1-like [Malania oleifera]